MSLLPCVHVNGGHFGFVLFANATVGPNASSDTDKASMSEHNARDIVASSSRLFGAGRGPLAGTEKTRLSFLVVVKSSPQRLVGSIYRLV